MNASQSNPSLSNNFDSFIIVAIKCDAGYQLVFFLFFFFACIIITG